MHRLTQLVIGNGEVGSSLAEVLRCPVIDKCTDVPSADVLHICFPYSSSFIKEAKRYIFLTNAKLVIVHSTVPVGVTRQLGAGVVHSPIRGKHPDLTGGILKFVKFCGGERALEAASIFSAVGIQTHCTDKSENTEAMKLWDTEIYRDAVLLNKKIYSYCKAKDLDFDVVYTVSNQSYNDGYRSLGMPQYSKYVLKYIPGPIGGHCLEPNHELLNQEIKTDELK